MVICYAAWKTNDTRLTDDPKFGVKRQGLLKQPWKNNQCVKEIEVKYRWARWIEDRKLQQMIGTNKKELNGDFRTEKYNV